MTTRHTQLLNLITRHLRDDLRRAYAKQVIEALPYEEASYWLSKVGTARGKKAFRILYGISNH